MSLDTIANDDQPLNKLPCPIEKCAELILVNQNIHRECKCASNRARSLMGDVVNQALVTAKIFVRKLLMKNGYVDYNSNDREYDDNGKH
jgi:hypothetical protein